MPKELKIIFLIFFVLPIFAFGLVVFKTNEPDRNSPIIGLETTTAVDQLGRVERLGGHIFKEYAFKNTTSQILNLGRLTTSCMCTKAKVAIANTASSWFSMESSGDKNPSLNYELKPGESGRVVVDFDPNAHGPKGVGPFDRTIQLFFNKPFGVKEFKFSGEII